MSVDGLAAFEREPFLFQGTYESKPLISFEKNNIFSNMPIPYPMKDNAIPHKNYKEILKKLATLNVNSRVEIGLDRMKVAPLSLKSNDNPSTDQGLLSPVKQASGFKSRGYGIELRIKLP